MSHLQQLMPSLLDPVQLVVKKISGNVITGKKLMHYVEVSNSYRTYWDLDAHSISYARNRIPL